MTYAFTVFLIGLFASLWLVLISIMIACTHPWYRRSAPALLDEEWFMDKSKLFGLATVLILSFRLPVSLLLGIP